MSIKYRSQILLIRIRAGRVNLTIPFPLFLISQTLEAIYNMVWIWGRIAPPERRIDPEQNKPSQINSGKFTAKAISDGCRLTQDFIKELRGYGSLRMVEVVTKDRETKNNIRIYIDFI